MLTATQIQIARAIARELDPFIARESSLPLTAQDLGPEGYDAKGACMLALSGGREPTPKTSAYAQAINTVELSSFRSVL